MTPEPDSCPKCGSTDPKVRLTVLRPVPGGQNVESCRHNWHDRPTGADRLPLEGLTIDTEPDKYGLCGLRLPDGTLIGSYDRPSLLSHGVTIPDPKCPEHGDRCTGPTCCCADKHPPTPEPDPMGQTVQALGEVEGGTRCPRCGSTDPAVRLPVAYRVFICNDPWHDRPTGDDDLDPVAVADRNLGDDTYRSSLIGHPPDQLDVSPGADLIAAERYRQVVEEGWTPEHDAEHVVGELTKAAEHYAMYASRQLSGYEPLDAGMPNSDPVLRGSYFGWPWHPDWWNPSDDPIRNLVKAGALIAAEIDRILEADR